MNSQISNAVRLKKKNPKKVSSLSYVGCTYEHKLWKRDVKKEKKKNPHVSFM